MPDSYGSPVVLSWWRCPSTADRPIIPATSAMAAARKTSSGQKVDKVTLWSDKTTLLSLNFDGLGSVGALKCDFVSEAKIMLHHTLVTRKKQIVQAWMFLNPSSALP